MTDTFVTAKPRMTSYYVFFALIGIASVVLGAMSIVQTKQKEADEDTASRVSNISSSLRELEYKDSVYELPETLSGVTDESLDGIDYKKISNTEYELCATFKTSTIEGSPPKNEVDTYISAHEHSEGQQCFKGKVEFSQKRSSAQIIKNNSYYDTSTLVRENNNTVSSPNDATCGVKGTNYSGEVGTVDLQRKRIYQKGSSTTSTNFVRYDSKTKFVDKNCGVIALSLLKSNDKIIFVANERDGYSMADIIMLQ